MSMKIADLFVQLGVKGDGKSKRALGGVLGGLQEIKSTSLGVKAGIAGVIYGLQQMMSHSMQQGAGLLQFAKFTGLSAEKLQQWQYAGKKVSVANAEIEGSIKAVQSAMSNMLLGKGAPEGMGMLSEMVGFDSDKARDTFYVMEKLQEMAQKAPADIGNKILQSFGISEGMITAMRRNAFTAKALNSAPLYSAAEIKKLEKINSLWSEMSHKMKITMGHISAERGVPIVKDIMDATNSLVKLIGSLNTLSGKIGVFEAIGKVITGWNLIFKETNDFVEGMNEKGGEGILKKGGSFLKDFLGFGFDNMKKITEDNKWRPPAGMQDMEHKYAGVIQSPKNMDNKPITVNQNLNFQHDGKDATKLAESTKQASNKAFRQMAQGQRN